MKGIDAEVSKLFSATQSDTIRVSRLVIGERDYEAAEETEKQRVIEGWEARAQNSRKSSKGKERAVI